MGRDFANRVATRLQEQAWGAKTECVELRFMGLWDTVAQFGLNGVANTDWQLAIPPQAKHVFHAVALNERRGLFPGVRIDLGVQRGFVGDQCRHWRQLWFGRPLGCGPELDDDAGQNQRLGDQTLEKYRPRGMINGEAAASAPSWAWAL